MLQPAALPEPDLVGRLLATLEERWVLSLATRSSEDGFPHIAPLFYACTRMGREGEVVALVFASNPQSQHSRNLEEASTAAAAVYVETEEVGTLRGIQLRGRVVDLASATEGAARHCRATYQRRHPNAGPQLDEGKHQLYAFVLSWAKLTDDRLGVGVHPEFTFTPNLASTGLERARGPRA